MIAPQDPAVTLTDADLTLLRLAQERGQIYASDNEAKWDRLLEADLLKAAPNPERHVDWHGGWMQISDAGRSVLAQIDRPASGSARTAPTKPWPSRTQGKR